MAVTFIPGEGQNFGLQVTQAIQFGQGLRTKALENQLLKAQVAQSDITRQILESRAETARIGNRAASRGEAADTALVGGIPRFMHQARQADIVLQSQIDASRSAKARSDLALEIAEEKFGLFKEDRTQGQKDKDLARTQAAEDREHFLGRRPVLEGQVDAAARAGLDASRDASAASRATTAFRNLQTEQAPTEHAARIAASGATTQAAVDRSGASQVAQRLANLQIGETERKTGIEIARGQLHPQITRHFGDADTKFIGPIWDQLSNESQRLVLASDDIKIYNQRVSQAEFQALTAQLSRGGGLEGVIDGPKNIEPSLPRYKETPKQHILRLAKSEGIRIPEKRRTRDTNVNIAEDISTLLDRGEGTAKQLIASKGLPGDTQKPEPETKPENVNRFSGPEQAETEATLRAEFTGPTAFQKFKNFFTAGRPDSFRLKGTPTSTEDFTDLVVDLMNVKPVSEGGRRHGTRFDMLSVIRRPQLGKKDREIFFSLLNNETLHRQTTAEASSGSQFRRSFNKEEAAYIFIVRDAIQRGSMIRAEEGDAPGTLDLLREKGFTMDKLTPAQIDAIGRLDNLLKGLTLLKKTPKRSQ